MSPPFRVSLLSLALSLSFLGTQSATSQSSVEAAVRAVIEKFFEFYSAKNVDALIDLWSAKSPDYASLRQNLSRELGAGDYRSTVPAISRVVIQGEQASLRAAVKLTAADPKSQPREQRIVRNLVLV